MLFIQTQDHSVAINSKFIRRISIKENDSHCFEVIADLNEKEDPITLGYAVSSPEAHKLFQTYLKALGVVIPVKEG